MLLQSLAEDRVEWSSGYEKSGMELCPDQFDLKGGGIYTLWSSKFGREFFAQIVRQYSRSD